MQFTHQEVQRLRDVFGQTLAKKLFAVPDPEPDPPAVEPETSEPPSEPGQEQPAAETPAPAEAAPDEVTPAPDPNAWRSESLSSGRLSAATVNELAQERITSYGDLDDYLAAGNDLTTIDGIGKKRAEEILAALAAVKA